MKPNILVFDVESTSLHGTGFAVGATVIYLRTGREIDKFELMSAEGARDACEWVKNNVCPQLHDMPVCVSDRMLRDAFWEFYSKHRETCDIWGDCVFPVETNFLSQIANDNLGQREFEMPYPLNDICTIIGTALDRNENCGISSSLRKHNPLDDARASARFVIGYLIEHE